MIIVPPRTPGAPQAQPDLDPVPSRRASGPELAILNHPDRRTSWVVVMTAVFSDPSPDFPELFTRRLRTMSAEAPILRARLLGGSWHPGQPPVPVLVEGDPLHAPGLLTPFALDREPPVRFYLSSDCRRLALAAHHAGLDGLAARAVIDGLLGHPLPGTKEQPSPPTPGPGSRGSTALALSRLRDPLRRFAAPADPVAPSASAEGRDVFAVRAVDLQGPNITGQVAAAFVAAAGARNARLARPWRRIGLSIAVGGAPAIRNVASYRRVDLRAGDDVVGAVQSALRGGDVPTEMTFAPRGLRLLAPLAERFSDSLLISNLGRTELPGVEEIVLYPCARGRSAVSVGASSVASGRSVVSVRARELSQTDAEDLLEDAVRRLEVRAPNIRPDAQA